MSRHNGYLLWLIIFAMVSAECVDCHDGVPFVMQTREELERVLRESSSLAILFCGRAPGCSECGQFERSYAAVRDALKERVAFTKFYLDATPDLAVSLNYQDRPLLGFFGGPDKLAFYQGGASPRSIAAFVLEQTRPEHTVEEFRADPDEPEVDVILRKISYDAVLLESEMSLLDNIFGALLETVDSVQKFSEFAHRNVSTLIGITNEKEGVFSSYFRDFIFLHPDLGTSFALCVEDEKHICTKGLKIAFPQEVLQQPEDHSIEREAVDDENTAPLRYDDEYSFFVLQQGQSKFKLNNLSFDISDIKTESNTSFSFPPQFLYDYIPTTIIPEETVGVTPFDFTKLLNFLYDKDTVLVNNASDYTFTSFDNKDFALLFTSTTEFIGNIKTLATVAKEHAEMKFFYSSDNGMMNHFGVHSLPTLLVYSSGRKEYYVMKNNFTIANGNLFIAAFKNHSLSPFVKSEQHSNNTEQNVTKLTGNELDNFINQEKNVFVLIHLELQTPFVKTFMKSAKNSLSNGAAYGMINKSKNSLPYAIEEYLFDYPALLLFPQGMKSEPILYKGSFSEKSLEAFFRDYRLKKHTKLSENHFTQQLTQTLTTKAFLRLLRKRSKVKTVQINSPRRLASAISNYRERVPVVVDFFVDQAQSYEKMISKLPSSLQREMVFLSHDCSNSTRSEKMIKKYVNGFPSLAVIYKDRIFHFDGLQTEEALQLFLRNIKSSLPPIQKMIGKSKIDIINDFVNELKSDKLFIYLLTTFNSNIFRSFQRYFDENKESISVPMHLYVLDSDVIEEIASQYNIKETVLTEKEGKSLFFSMIKNEHFLKSKDLYRIIPIKIDQENALESISLAFNAASIPFYGELNSKTLGIYQQASLVSIIFHESEKHFFKNYIRNNPEVIKELETRLSFCQVADTEFMEDYLDVDLNDVHFVSYDFATNTFLPFEGKLDDETLTKFIIETLSEKSNGKLNLKLHSMINTNHQKEL